MNRFRKIVLVFCVGAVLVVAIFAVVQVGQHRRERELAETLALYQRMAWEDDGALAKAREKVSAKDIPTLLKWLQGGNGPEWRRDWERRLYSAIARSDEELLRKHDLPALAVCGFEVLGTNGAPAIPNLTKMVRGGRAEDEVIYAIGGIGQPAWGMTKELVHSTSPNERLYGAWLLGALRMNEEESVPMLSKLSKDADMSVREWACVALAEFPCEESEEVFWEMIAADDHGKTLLGVYGLHNAGAKSTERLVMMFESCTNESVRVAILNMFYMQDRLKHARKPRPPVPAHDYHRKFEWFNHAHSEINGFIEGGHDVDALWARVRPRILAGEEARFDEEMKRLRESR